MKIRTILVFFSFLLLFSCNSSERQKTNNESSSEVVIENGSLYVHENTSPNEKLSSLYYSESDNSYLAYYGKKDKNGSILYIDEAISGNLNSKKYITFKFDLLYRISKIEFSSGRSIIFDNYTGEQVNVNFFDKKNNLISSQNIYIKTINNTIATNSNGIRLKSSNDISENQNISLSNPDTITLCRKRERSVKINLPVILNNLSPKALSATIASISDMISTTNTIANADKEEIKKLVESKAIGMIKGGNEIKMVVDSLSTSNKKSIDDIALVIDMLKNISPFILEGSINECEDVEKTNDYLFARCAGQDLIARNNNFLDTPTCKIDAGSKIDVAIYYYKPEELVNKEYGSPAFRQ